MSCDTNSIFDERFILPFKGSELKLNLGVIVVGGGLAGLVATNLLIKSGVKVLLLEKKQYPFHRVCGEYVSNEVLDFLKREKLYPTHLQLPRIGKFLFSDTAGKSVSIPLDLGGFGVSRYILDDFLYQKALQSGAAIHTGVQVDSIRYRDKEDCFNLELSDGSCLSATYVIGAYGKRSRLDKVLKRPFIEMRSPYIGVKYHLYSKSDRSTIALHNFQGGYCGINAIEEGKFNLCYLGSRDQLRKFGSIEEMEREILWKNPLLKQIFSEGEFLFNRPEVINEINFEEKRPVENHILMVGDAAGLITPLCGNGMAMAIHSGKLAFEAIQSGKTRLEVERNYEALWREEFARRLMVGRWSQKLFGAKSASGLARYLIHYFPAFARQVIKRTHGRPF